MSARFLCGAEVLFCKLVKRETPHRSRCRCSALFSSDKLCHLCSCAACAAARVEWMRRINATRRALKAS